MRGLVGYPTNVSSNSTSNRVEGPLHISNSVGEISVISKSNASISTAGQQSGKSEIWQGDA